VIDCYTSGCAPQGAWLGCLEGFKGGALGDGARLEPGRAMIPKPSDKFSKTILRATAELVVELRGELAGSCNRALVLGTKTKSPAFLPGSILIK